MVRAIDYKYDSFESGFDCFLMIDKAPETAADFPADIDDVYNLHDDARSGRKILPGSFLMTPGGGKVWQMGFDDTWVEVGAEQTAGGGN